MYLPEEQKIWLATGDERVYLLPAMANRHGLIAGATGTGKTVTLKVIAESFSDMGVPVFLADIQVAEAMAGNTGLGDGKTLRDQFSARFLPILHIQDNLLCTIFRFFEI